MALLSTGAPQGAFRISVVPKRAPRSSGLGLALVRQIARRHGGDARYDGERGSAFAVTLPV